MKIWFFLISFIVHEATTATAAGVDDVHNKMLTGIVDVVQVAHQQPRNMKIESQKKVLLLKDDVIRQQQGLRFLSIVTMSLLIVLIFFLFRNNKERKNEKSYLEAKVNDRTLELQYMYDILERSYHEQEQSILKTSRDVKDQLTTIRGLCSLIRLESGDKSSEAFVTDMEEKINTLSSTLDNLSVNEYLIKYNK